MALVLGTNSYSTVAEADAYFEDRLDVAAWDNADDDMKSKAIVTATRWLENQQFAGYSTEDDQSLAWPRVGRFFDEGRGREITFERSYEWVEIDSTDFLGELKALPREIELLKKASFEQAYYLISNEGVYDYSGSAQIPANIRVGSIALEGLSGGRTAPSRSALAYDYLKPLLMNSGINTWYRAN